MNNPEALHFGPQEAHVIALIRASLQGLTDSVIKDLGLPTTEEVGSGIYTALVLAHTEGYKAGMNAVAEDVSRIAQRLIDERDEPGEVVN